MKKCIDCENMKIVSIEDGCGAAAKCFKTSSRGKAIYWAMTTVSPSNNWTVEEEGKSRVTAIMESKKAPFWCPLKKETKSKETVHTKRKDNTMTKSEIKSYFGKTILTTFGDCYVEGFSDDETCVILHENGEPFAFTIEDFISELKEYN